MNGKIGTLYLVATPIGNLEDITYRAVRVLSEVDLIACEDTRHSIKLLNHLGIKKPLISFHEHSSALRAQELLDKLKSGQSIALVSDAGMPMISDPGEDMVSLCIREDVPVTVVPGCSASLTGLILSGLPARRFAFEGFLPQQQGERRKALEALKYEERTMIFYEGPHRIKKMLSDALAVLGNRPCSLARELTKLHEEVLRGPLSDMLHHFESNEPKGEFVVVVGGNPKTDRDEGKDFEGLSISDHVQSYLDEGLDRMEAMKRAAKDRGLSKRDIYQALNKPE